MSARTIVCPECNGEGTAFGVECKTCEGIGYLWEDPDDFAHRNQIPAVLWDADRFEFDPEDPEEDLKFIRRYLKP